MSFKEIKAEDFQEGAFKLIGKDWLLVTGAKEGKANAMTASWGGLGVMWGKNVAFLVIRPQRYTKEFLDAKEELTISVFPEEKRSMMSYFGTVSGRDEDKIAKAGLTVVEEAGRVYYEEARLVMLCKKLYAQEMTEESFFDKEALEKWYGAKDYHTLYIVEVEKILLKE